MKGMGFLDRVFGDPTGRDDQGFRRTTRKRRRTREERRDEDSTGKVRIDGKPVEKNREE